LHRSASEIRCMAEENAHAFKTLIAIIRQSLEPLRRALPEDNQRAHRAIGIVDHSLDRLDGLVGAARRLDEATADLLATPRVPIDLGQIIGGLIQIQSAVLASRDVTIILASHDLTMSADLVPGLFVLGTEEMIESIAENLIDNAVSFAPPGSEILVHLTRDDRFAHLAVSDEGPGVPLDSSSASSTVIMPGDTPNRRTNPPRAISGSGYRSHAAMSRRWVGRSRPKTERHRDYRCIYAYRSRPGGD